MRYRIELPTMVLASSGHHQAAVTIQPGTIVDLIGPAPGDDRFLVIQHGDQEFHVFASDLAARGREVKDGI